MIIIVFGTSYVIDSLPQLFCLSDIFKEASSITKIVVKKVSI